MSLNSNEDFMRDLNYCKQGKRVWGTDFEIDKIIYCLRRQVKDYFPLNGVPDHIVQSLDCLDIRVKIALEQLTTTVDKIIYEVEKIDGLEKK